MVSSVGSLCYALDGYPHKMICPVAGRLESFVKNSYHFLQLLHSVLCTLVSFEVSSSTNALVDEARKSSVINSLTLRFWRNGRFRRSKPLLNCFLFA
jgi:hypothetical protein